MNRYNYIDISKGIGILMVVWAHIMLAGWTHQMFYAFHMPLFFLLSGMLFRRDKYASFSSFHAHRAKRLLIPYVIYSVATWVIWAAFRYLRHDEVDSYLMPLLQTFIARGSGAFFVHNSALWFIPCLFLVEILYFWICKLGKWGCFFVCFACAALSFGLGAIYGGDYWFTPYWNADAALIALPFYCVGNMITREIGHKRIVQSVTNNKVWSAVACLIMTVVLFWSSISFGVCSMGSSSYGCQGWIFLLRAFLGCAWLILLSILIESLECNVWPVRYLKLAGKNSLDIMCLHIPVKGICMILIAMILKMTVDDISVSELYSFYAFVPTMIIVWLCIRIIPVSTITHKFV